MAEINIGGELVPKTMAKKVAKAEYLYDPNQGDKKQSEINEELYQSKDVLLFDRIITEELPHIGATTDQTPNAIVYASFYKRFLAVVGTGDFATYYYAWPKYEKYTDTARDNKPYDNKVYLGGGRTYVWDGTDLVAGSGGEPITIDPQPTKDSHNAVSSGGTFGVLQQLNEINATQSEDGKLYFDYPAGYIVYTESEDGKRTYWVSYAAGTADDDNPVDINALLFYRADNAVDAIRFSLSITTVSATEQQSLTDEQKAQAQNNIGVRKGVANGVASLNEHGFVPQEQTLAVRFNEQPLTDSQKVQALNNIEGKTYNPLVFSGLGKKIFAKKIQQVGGVMKNVMTQAFFQDAQDNDLENTVFVIQYDYTLVEDVTIPNNCVLKFDGGSIEGGNNTLTLQDTLIDAPNTAVFNNVIFSGTIRNGAFNAIWIKGTDIGQSVNIAAIYFKKIYLQANDYVFTTPMLLDQCQYVSLLGSYRYNGVLTNGMAVVRFNECRNAHLKFGDLRLTDAVIAQMSYADNRTKNIIGVNLDNSGNTSLFVKSVVGFNEGIRVSATETNSGDCFVEATTLFRNNIGVRIYQQNGPNYTPGTNVQYVNDTNIRINYCNPLSGVTGTKYGVVVAGPAFDNVSYKDPNVVDSYDHCSGVVIEGGDYENNTVGFYCRNTEIAIENAREENMTTLIKAVGSLKLRYQPKYVNGISALSNIDFTECTKFINNGIPAFTNNISYNIESLIYKFSGYDYVCPNNYYIMKEAGIHTGKLLYTNVAGIGVIVDAINTKILHLGRNNKGRFIIAYLDSNNNNITEGKNKPNDAYFLTTEKVYILGADSYASTVIIPSDVTKVFIGIMCNEKDSLTVLSYGAHIDNNQIALSGTTRPVALPKNVPFFDESLGMPVYWSGTKYIKADGTDADA